MGTGKGFSFSIVFLLSYIIYCVKGGQSIWKKHFKDEFKPNLTHSGKYYNCYCSILIWMMFRTWCAQHGKQWPKHKQISVVSVLLPEVAVLKLVICEQFHHLSFLPSSRWKAYCVWKVKCGLQFNIIIITIVDRLVGGLEVLTEMEGVLTDHNDKPMVHACTGIYWGLQSL